MSLGGGDAEGMAAGGSSSSSSSDEDSDDAEDAEEEDEEPDELPLSESKALSSSPSESAYREHLEDEPLSSSSPAKPEGAVRRGGKTLPGPRTGRSLTPPRECQLVPGGPVPPAGSRGPPVQGDKPQWEGWGVCILPARPAKGRRSCDGDTEGEDYDENGHGG